MQVTICGSFHPVELEWHCQCRKDPHHPGNHCCYGCGFEWEQGDPHSRMPDETDQTLLDVLGITPDVAEQMNADLKREIGDAG
jgi:hypothetical protein